MSSTKFILQAFTLTKTCITVYRKAGKLYHWYRNDPQDRDKTSCIVVDLTAPDEAEGFILVTSDDVKGTIKKKATGMSYCKNSFRKMFQKTPARDKK